MLLFYILQKGNGKLAHVLSGKKMDLITNVTFTHSWSVFSILPIHLQAVP